MPTVGNSQASWDLVEKQTDIESGKNSMRTSWGISWSPRQRDAGRQIGGLNRNDDRRGLSSPPQVSSSAFFPRSRYARPS